MNNAQIERFVRSIDTSIVVLPLNCIQFKQNNWRVMMHANGSVHHQSVWLNVNVKKKMDKNTPPRAPDGLWLSSASALYFQFALLSSFSFDQTFCIFTTLSNQFHPKLLGLIRQCVVSNNKIQNEEIFVQERK